MKLTLGGWLIMIVSVGGVTTLFGWCIARVLRQPSTTERIHGPIDIDTHDAEP